MREPRSNFFKSARETEEARVFKMVLFLEILESLYLNNVPHNNLVGHRYGTSSASMVPPDVKGVIPGQP